MSSGCSPGCEFSSPFLKTNWQNLLSGVMISQREQSVSVGFLTMVKQLRLELSIARISAVDLIYSQPARPSQNRRGRYGVAGPIHGKVNKVSFLEDGSRSG